MAKKSNYKKWIIIGLIVVVILLNFFPFQYFTTISNEIFETEFPFTVPNDYKGKFSIELVAKVDSIKDSIRIDIPTYIK